MIDQTEEITEPNRSSDGNALTNSQEIDSKYRMIILAAQRSKQLQRGATPRVDADPRKSKPTRIAMKELETGKVNYETFTESQYSTKQ